MWICALCASTHYGKKRTCQIPWSWRSQQSLATWHMGPGNWVLCKVASSLKCWASSPAPVWSFSVDYFSVFPESWAFYTHCIWKMMRISLLLWPLNLSRHDHEISTIWSPKQDLPQDNTSPHANGGNFTVLHHKMKSYIQSATATKEENKSSPGMSSPDRLHSQSHIQRSNHKYTRQIVFKTIINNKRLWIWEGM